ncbi:MAG: DUF1993 family protein [Paracoccaceae bacterium]
MMDDSAFYQASVPVFRRYLAQIEALVAAASEEALEARLAADAFAAGLHFRIAQGYVLRSVWPLIGREVPALPEGGHDGAALLVHGAAVTRLLDGVSVADFVGASARMIEHEAGFAKLAQPATEFLTLYGLPNFFFHLVNGYATLRQSGVKIGKGDFDGLHSYPTGFSFEAAGGECG